jgi:gas vesicle structural protein
VNDIASRALASSEPSFDATRTGSPFALSSLIKVEVQRTPASDSVIDVLDRVLDKGIVLAAWIRVSLVGIDVITVSARITVASIETYLRYADVLQAAIEDEKVQPPLAATSGNPLHTLHAGLEERRNLGR